MSEGTRWTRDEQEVALNDVFSLCLEIADHCEDASARLRERSDAPLAQLLDQVAAQRRAQAARLRRLLRARDELPDEPDPDREAVHRAVAWVKAVVADDEERTLLEMRLEQEQRLAELCRRALALDLPDDAARCVEGVAREAAEGRSRLERALQAETAASS
jgi:hypothetical protein